MTDMSIFLQQMTDEDLQAEIERRQKKADKPPRMRKLLIDNALERDDPEVSRAAEALRNACIGHTEMVLDGHPEPDKHYIYEAALTLFYGEAYWDWINKRVV